MQRYDEMSPSQQREELQALLQQYHDYQSMQLKLDMSRGKPAADQLSLSQELLSNQEISSLYRSEDGTDCRNYGVLDGLSETKRLFADILEVTPDKVIVGGNSSLTLMFDFIAQAMTHGTGGLPWGKQEGAQFLCVVPGYDRHFSILEHFGIEMVLVPFREGQPDMELVETLVQNEKVKGLICVPKYSNPDGITFSEETVKRLAAMKTAAEDFRIIWDNAYCLHDIYSDSDSLLCLLTECEKAGNPDRAVMFASTSKITFPGAGISALAASPNNIAQIKKRMSFQTIGPDKLNQLQHTHFLKNLDTIKEHMQKHAVLVRPKFEAVLTELQQSLGELGFASWVPPNGGYFISLNVLPGTAQRTVALCKEAGVVLTPAGATFPYGKDPLDQNIRISPTFPPIEELQVAAKLLCLCTRIAALEKLLAQ